MAQNAITEYGFTSVPRDLDKFLANADPNKDKPKGFQIEEVLPQFNPLMEKVDEYARKDLPELTYNHSRRVICFGLAIYKQFLQSPPLSEEAFVLSALLHDLGTAPHIHKSTLFSFEYSGGLLAHSELLSHKAPKHLAESVAEAIIRHQDIGKEGNITVVGGILQVATVLDNTGKFLDLLDENFVRAVCQKWPRTAGGETWTGCFANVVESEMREKPWSHTTTLGSGFVDAVNANKGMQKYEVL